MNSVFNGENDDEQNHLHFFWFSVIDVRTYFKVTCIKQILNNMYPYTKFSPVKYGKLMIHSWT